jgi:hypothetical protein
MTNRYDSIIKYDFTAVLIGFALAKQESGSVWAISNQWRLEAMDT